MTSNNAWKPFIYVRQSKTSLSLSNLFFGFERQANIRTNTLKEVGSTGSSQGSNNAKIKSSISGIESDSVILFFEQNDQKSKLTCKTRQRT